MTWADFITNDIENRVLNGKPLPTKLTLHSLCSEYGVSITPIRQAIDLLLEKSIFIKDKSGRLKLNSHKMSHNVNRHFEQVSCPPADLYGQISRELVVESLSEKTHFLRESAMAKKYATGRTVIRRIFNRLAGEGIIDHIPRCGWKLRSFNKEDLAAFLQVREILELKALDLAKNHLEQDELIKMLEQNKIDDKHKNVTADNSFHNYLIKQSGNRYIKDFFEHYGRYYEILFTCEDTDLKSRILAVKQHRKILKALLKQDWHNAKKYLAQHIHINHSVLNSQPELILKLVRR
ncbi:MAG: hypothetical protein A2Y10_13740 [Planctomycetes bacterium GWF2_41_51]|nr:MAG: hypothetical protein A2Y10_13740 [Planctomycetes bacterium GWF2_41_51]HBG25988.1 transcriptional regulator [Phycisphaerales bacterium]